MSHETSGNVSRHGWSDFLPSRDRLGREIEWVLESPDEDGYQHRYGRLKGPYTARHSPRIGSDGLCHYQWPVRPGKPTTAARIIRATQQAEEALEEIRKVWFPGLDWDEEQVSPVAQTQDGPVFFLLKSIQALSPES